MMTTPLTKVVRSRRTFGALQLASTIVVGTLFLSPSVAATDLRGRIESQNQYTSVPSAMNGATVELLDASGSRVVARYSTGPDGMYYFRNIAPGKYKVRVSGAAYPITVESRPAQDLGPIRLRR